MQILLGFVCVERATISSVAYQKPGQTCITVCARVRQSRPVVIVRGETTYAHKKLTEFVAA